MMTNERLKELEAEAIEYTKRVYDLEYDDISTFQETIRKKFAELIIQECIDIVEYQYQPGEYVAQDIREHFGVK